MIIRVGGAKKSERFDKERTLHQFSNDWITVREDNEVYEPLWCKPSEEELVVMRQSKNSGMFWFHYEVGPEGFFVLARPR